LKQKKLLFAVSVIILVGVYFIWGMNYVYSWALANNEDEQTPILEQIADVQEEHQQIIVPDVDIQQLEYQLEEAKRNLDEERNIFPSDINSNEIIQTILMLADDSEVELCPISTQRWLTQNMDMHSYSFIRMQITAEGTLLGLGSFIYKLEHSNFDTLILDYVNLTLNTPDEDLPDEEEVIYDIYTATINLSVYTQDL
jgi:hypothetical protein